MTIYELAHSPFCLPVRRILEAAGVPYTTVEVPNHDRSDLLRLTGGAAYQVPVLDDGGTLVFETGADTQDVARHLDATVARGALFPLRWEGWQAILLPHLENEVESATFKLCDIHYIPTIQDPGSRGMLIRHKERKFGRGCVDHWRNGRDALWAQAVSLLTPFDQMVSQSAFLTGDQPIYADFLLWGILGNLTWKEWNPFPPLPALQDWHTRMSGYSW